MLVSCLLLVSRAAAVTSGCWLLLCTAQMTQTAQRALLLGEGLLLAQAGQLLVPRLQLVMVSTGDTAAVMGLCILGSAKTNLPLHHQNGYLHHTI